jgi:hypothetical protein
MRVFWISGNFGNARALLNESGKYIYFVLEAFLTTGIDSNIHRFLDALRRLLAPTQFRHTAMKLFLLVLSLADP